MFGSSGHVLLCDEKGNPGVFLQHAVQRNPALFWGVLTHNTF